jgi:hypothetical protein
MRPVAISAITATIAAVFVASASVFAQAPQKGPASPGSWQVTPSSTSSASVSYNLCFKTGGMDEVRSLLPRVTQNAANCKEVDASQGAQLRYTLTCPSPALKVNAIYDITPQAVEGRIVTERAGEPPEVQTIRARRVGDC